MARMVMYQVGHFKSLSGLFYRNFGLGFYKSLLKLGGQVKNLLPGFAWSSYKFGQIPLFFKSPQYPKIPGQP